MAKCKWCEDEIPEGARFCDELCAKLAENRQAQQGELGPREWQKRRQASHRNEVRSGNDGFHGIPD